MFISTFCNKKWKKKRIKHRPPVVFELSARRSFLFSLFFFILFVSNILAKKFYTRKLKVNDDGYPLLTKTHFYRSPTLPEKIDDESFEGIFFFFIFFFRQRDESENPSCFLVLSSLCTASCDDVVFNFCNPLNAAKSFSTVLPPHPPIPEMRTWRNLLF